MSMQAVGFIGLGRMGKPMAANLSRKGFDLVVYDVSSKAVEALRAVGARSADSVAEVARGSEVILTMVPGSAEMEAIVLGEAGLLANGRSGQLIMDMSTIEPGMTDRIAARAAEKGISFVDAPVGRLASHADRGECLFMVGASKEDLERVMPLLQAMGTTIHHCGKVGMGGRTKLVNNYLTVVSCQLNAEALALSQRFGLDLEKDARSHQRDFGVQRPTPHELVDEGAHGGCLPGIHHRPGAQGPFAHRGRGQCGQSALARCSGYTGVLQPGALGPVRATRFLGNRRCALRILRNREAPPEGAQRRSRFEPDRSLK